MENHEEVDEIEEKTVAPKTPEYNPFDAYEVKTDEQEDKDAIYEDILVEDEDETIQTALMESMGHVEVKMPLKEKEQEDDDEKPKAMASQPKKKEKTQTWRDIRGAHVGFVLAIPWNQL